MRPCWVFALTLCAAIPAHGTVLRSGEHADFSRVVVELPQAVEWTFGRYPGGYAFAAEALVAPTDISSVFRMIPRTRVADIRYDTDGEILVFELACAACYADAFEIRNGRIVLDFKDGAPPAESAFERELVLNTTTVEAERVTATEEIAEEPAATTPAVAIPVSAPRSFLPSLDFLQPAAQATPVELGPVEQDLVNALSRAMTQGLVAVSDFSPSPRILAGTGDTNPNLETDVNLPAQVQTQIEHDRSRADIASTEPEKPQCTKKVARYPLPQETSFNDLGPLRAELFNDLDRIEAEAALDLAATQIALGFAVEAKATLALLPQKVAEAEYLSHVAHVVAAKPLPKGVFSEALGCQSPELIWALLSAPTTPTLNIEAADKAVLQFFNLSAQLRRYLGPRLAEKLLNAGRTAQARRVAENAQKLDPAAATDLAQIDVEPQVAQSLGLEPMTETAAAVEEVDSGSTKVLQRLLQRAIDQNRDLASEDLVFIDSAIFQFRREEAGQELAQLKLLYALNRKQSSLTREALDVLTDNDLGLDAELLAESFAILSEQGDEFNYLLLKSYLSGWGGDVVVPRGATNARVEIDLWLQENTQPLVSTIPTEIGASGPEPAIIAAPSPSAAQTLAEKMDRLAAIVGRDPG